MSAWTDFRDAAEAKVIEAVQGKPTANPAQKTMPPKTLMNSPLLPLILIGGALVVFMVMRRR